MRSAAEILDHPAVSGCYLFPQDRMLPRPDWITVPGARLACAHHVVDPDQRTLVHFHGNGEAVADYVPHMAQAFAELGLNSLFVEYREYGGSTGHARLVEMLPDGDAVLDQAGLAPERVIAFGRSIGSLYAIELAFRRPQLAGLVIESGIASPAERFLARADFSHAPFTKEDVLYAAAEKFDHQLKLSTCRQPLLILHAEHDGLVDISHAERNFAWSASSRKRLVRFPIGDHNSLHWRNATQYQQELKQFVDSLETPVP